MRYDGRDLLGFLGLMFVVRVGAAMAEDSTTTSVASTTAKREVWSSFGTLFGDKTEATTPANNDNNTAVALDPRTVVDNEALFSNSTAANSTTAVSPNATVAAPLNATTAVAPPDVNHNASNNASTVEEVPPVVAEDAGNITEAIPTPVADVTSPEGPSGSASDASVVKDEIRKYSVIIGGSVPIVLPLNGSAAKEFVFSKDGLDFYDEGCNQEFCRDWVFSSSEKNFTVLVKNASLADAGNYTFDWIDHDQIRVALTVVAAPDPTEAATTEATTTMAATTEESGRDKVVSTKPENYPEKVVLGLSFTVICNDGVEKARLDTQEANLRMDPEKHHSISMYEITVKNESDTRVLPSAVKISCYKDGNVTSSKTVPFHYPPRAGDPPISVVKKADERPAFCGTTRVECQVQAHPAARFQLLESDCLGTCKKYVKVKLNTTCIRHEKDSNRAEFYMDLKADKQITCNASNAEGFLLILHTAVESHTSKNLHTIVVIVVIVVLVAVSAFVARYLARARKHRETRRRPFEGHFNLVEARAQKGEATQLAASAEMESCGSRL